MKKAKFFSSFQNFFQKYKLCFVWNWFIAKIILILQKYLFCGYSKWQQIGVILAWTGLSSNFWWVRSANHGKFTEECVMCTEKYVLVKKCLQLFKEGWNNIQDKGRHTMAGTPEMVDSVRALIMADRKVKLEDISKKLGISVITAPKIVRDDLVFFKLSCCWVSPEHHLTG